MRENEMIGYNPADRQIGGGGDRDRGEDKERAEGAFGCRFLIECTCPLGSRHIKN